MAKLCKGEIVYSAPYVYWAYDYPVYILGDYGHRPVYILFRVSPSIHTGRFYRPCPVYILGTAESASTVRYSTRSDNNATGPARLVRREVGTRQTVFPAMEFLGRTAIYVRKPYVPA